MNLKPSTLMVEGTGVPFDEVQVEQIAVFRHAWRTAGRAGEPRASVTCSALPITSDFARMVFGPDAGRARVGVMDGPRSRFGRTFIGEPDVIAEALSQDAAVQAADPLLLTVPNQLGVADNAQLLEPMTRDKAPRWAGEQLRSAKPR